MKRPKKLPGRNKLKRRIAPGLWIDTDGHGHISVEEILKDAGLDVNDENIRMGMEMAKEAIRLEAPELQIIERLKPD